MGTYNIFVGIFKSGELHLHAAHQNRSSHRDDRVVGGTAVDISLAPFIASLQQYSQHFCGGAIVSATYVVTAAHCAPT